MNHREISRREFLRLGALTAAGTALAGCCPSATETPAPPPEDTAEPKATDKPEPTKVAVEEATEVPAPESAFSESPMLADMVDAGDLPPVDDRLPLNPRVIEGLGDEPGYYSDEMRLGFVGASPEWGVFLFTPGFRSLLNQASTDESELTSEEIEVTSEEMVE